MISYSIPCKNNFSSNFLFNFIKNQLEQNNISDVKLIFDEDQKQLYIDTLKARVWVDIYNIETTLSDLKDTVLGKSLILSCFPDKKENDVLYFYMYDICSKSRDPETIKIMNKLAYVLSKSENSFIFDDNGILAGKCIYLPDEIGSFII
ncbi:hypothetical protein [Acinetobacter guillouiae]|uniref:hypothetical protein n=1 Tax=Acinetobacter guillouiae TaxID=106649 RepID=UPI0004EF665F|nr:hypothetical protein [Acinetobacter guillouiae]MBP2543778.1 hypothetical protein [Acinetobacter guillouiae]BAP36450.1 hypothetical protein AS4_15100 [Acinetobacter guillouiae]